MNKNHNENELIKNICMGIIAHVDAGKTTLSESMLYLSGKIRKMGHVDRQDTFLDTYAVEKARGITIFSKQARLEIEETHITLLDTPGHVDFSAEMERTLQVLDYAILVISGADGVQGHTRTIWHLLNMYHIPVFIFINKMDQPGTDKTQLLTSLKKDLSDACVNFMEPSQENFYDALAMCDETLMEAYLEDGEIADELIIEAIKARQVFPCFFGSALKLEGVEAFMAALARYTISPQYDSEVFGAKIFKISRDEQGNRLTHMKITGGTLKVKTLLSNQPSLNRGDIETHGIWEEKINQIRLYSGQKFESTSEVSAGTICAVTGLNHTKPGQGIGSAEMTPLPILEPVLSYRILLPEGIAPSTILPKLRELEEEEPELHIIWDEHLQEIQVQIMGEVQIEILQNLIKERFNLDVSFGSGTILYKETITRTVEGVGHFEPLRHYAEVHLLLEPGERGSGVQFDSQVSEDLLEKNWQRLILTHLEEKTHKGVLTGAPITDIKMTLVAGRAHKKHTEGGDFREATYRSVRQGLMQGESILLEPYYAFQLELPEKMVGRAMMDIEKMKGTCEITHTDGETATLTGKAPVVTMRNYQQEVVAYTKGFGRLFCTLDGYAPCHNTEEVLTQIGYDPERDIENPTGSVFCAHGAGFLVTWDKVFDYMHIESYLKNLAQSQSTPSISSMSQEVEEPWIGLDEIDQILHQTYYKNQGEKSAWRKRKTARESYYEPVTYRPSPKKVAYLLVDGYNIIYAWPELKALAEDNMDGARIQLLEILCNYQGMRQCQVIAVFDAYRVKGHYTETMEYHNIHVVYTKEAETADHYIEKFAHTHSAQYDITVATSDGLEQVIIRGAGCRILSAHEFKVEVKHACQTLMSNYQTQNPEVRHTLEDALTDEMKDHLHTLIIDNNN